MRGEAAATQAPGRQWRAEQFYLYLLLVPLAFFTVFFAWPIVRVMLRSVLEPQPGLGNYARAFGEPTYVSILITTFAIAAAVTVICLLLAYPLAYLISRQRGAMLVIATGLVLVPLWTSVVIRSYAWMILFQRNGIVNQAIVGLGFSERPVQILQSWTAVLVGMVHILLPFMVLPLLSAIRGVDQTLVRAGRVLGAPPITLFFRVYLPLTRPGITAGVSLVFITALGFYVTPALLGGAKGTMAAVLIEQQASTFFDWPLASALATILMAAAIVVYGLYMWMLGGASRRPA